MCHPTIAAHVYRVNGHVNNELIGEVGTELLPEDYISTVI